MKILVRFVPGARNDIFEGTRLRKCIKGGLELNNIKWVESIFAEPDVCHFLSPIDEAKAHEAKAEGYPVVVSALYAESDPYCRYLERSPENFYSLPQKSLKMLNEADLILVPSVSAKTLLFQCGFQSQNIEIFWSQAYRPRTFSSNVDSKARTSRSSPLASTSQDLRKSTLLRLRSSPDTSSFLKKRSTPCLLGIWTTKSPLKKQKSLQNWLQISFSSTSAQRAK